MLEGSRELKRSDFSKDNFSDLPDLGATTLDKEVFLLSYHCHISVDTAFTLPIKKRRIMMKMLEEQKKAEQKEIEKASKKR